MNLNEYFNQQKQQHVNDTAKLDMYQDFMLKNMKRSFSRKRSVLHVKSVVYSMVIMFLLFGFYGVYFFNNQGGEYDAAISNTAEAGYIAKIVDFNGSFYITTNNGKKVQTSNIQDGDIVTLQSKTTVVFHINDTTKAQLVGPAKFSVSKIGEDYKLNIIEGDFVEMKTLDSKKIDKVQLNMKESFTLEQGSNNPIDFQLIQEGEKSILKNNGGKLLVITLGEDNETIQTSINNKQVLSIQKNDVALFDNIDKFTKAIRSKDISQTFTFNSAKETLEKLATDTGTDNSDIQEIDLPELLKIEDQEVDQSILSQLGSVFTDTKKTPSEDQISAIRGSLTKAFLLSDLEGMYTNALKGNITTSNNIEKKVSSLYAKFKIKYSSKNSIQGLKESVSTFIDTVSENYLMPPKYFDTLYTLNNRLDYIGGIKGDETMTDEQINQSWNDLISNLPSRLIFN